MSAKFYGANKLVPAVVMDEQSKNIIKVVSMNEEAFYKTLEFKTLYYYVQDWERVGGEKEINGNHFKVAQMRWNDTKDRLIVSGDLLA